MSTEQRIPNPFGGPVCDFCLARNPRWSYDPVDITVGAEVVPAPAGSPPGTTAYHLPSADAWACCNRCSTIIERGDVKALARACAETAARRLHEACGTHYTREDIEADYAKQCVRLAELLPQFKPRRRPSAGELRLEGEAVVGPVTRVHRPGMN